MRRYDLQNIYNILGRDTAYESKKKVVYCRVSSKKQIDDLERQIDFFKSNYPDHAVVTDIGSGINWKRKGLKTILEQSMQRNISEIVVAHRDRLCRFGFELLEWLFQMFNVKLIVLESSHGQSSDAELTDDILSIIYVYSCRNMGRRRYKGKKCQTLPNSKTEENTETMDGNQ